ncbi:Glycosyltransferase involved in cell wall bisynthesis [Ruminococcaceae bacterium FB2012]|nr:Glycosyltransferase involved in cell wall bisynthesis [Ruminococcaceae bacterium FB2012]
MQGYYIFFGSKSSGVYNKVNMQIHEFKTISKIELITMALGRRTIWDKLKSRVVWLPLGFDYSIVISKIKNPDYIYIRRFTADSSFIKFLSYIKATYPKCKIVIEVFTYPYDKDDYSRNTIHFIRQLPFYAKDLIYRRKYRKYVDRIVTYSKDNLIFGVETIKTSNGVYVDQINKKNSNMHIDSKTIYLTSVAHMQVHHGFERLIKGIANYYNNGGKREIIYNVVGDGVEVKKYKKMVTKYGIESHVLFHGKLIGDELDNVYNHTDIAVSSLGLYKYKINTISTLKEGEYLAKGLPTIAGCKISLICDEEPPFILVFSNDSSPINIDRIIDFYDNIYMREDKEKIVDEIRSFAKTNVDMPVVMQPIIQYLTAKE